MAERRTSQGRRTLLHEFCATLEAAGVKLESGPEHSDRFGIYHAFLRDPDGYLIEIQRFDDPSWNQPGVEVGVDGDGQELY